MNKQIPLLAAALLLIQVPAWSADMADHSGHDTAVMQSTDAKKDSRSDMDHSQMKGMDHSQMKGMDHSQMKGRKPSDPSSNSETMPGMSSESTLGSEGGEMQMAPMQGGSAPPDARDANAYSDGYEPSAHSHMGEQNFGALLVEKLEAVRTSDKPSTSYDVKAWLGRDFDRVVVKAEGEIDKGKLQDARTEILWGHAIAPYWDTQLGLRYDSGVGPGRGWLAFGVEGLSPYWFDLEATAYVGNESRTALRFAASYDILFSQKLVLKPKIEANLFGKDDPEREIGSGLSSITTGLRLRYEINRQFAPYIGVEWKNMFGGTADYARLAGEKTNEYSLVAGVHLWF